jgi:hypothetical protein
LSGPAQRNAKLSFVVCQVAVFLLLIGIPS